MCAAQLSRAPPPWETEYGAIVARLQAAAPESDFARGVRQFGYLLMRVLAGPFGFVPLGWPMLASLLGVVAGYLAATELVKTRKYWFGRKAGSSTSA